jgi:hypothetical protein
VPDDRIEHLGGTQPTFFAPELADTKGRFPMLARIARGTRADLDQPPSASEKRVKGREIRVERSARRRLLRLAEHVVVQELRHDEHVADVDHSGCVGASRPSWITVEECGTDRLRAHVGAAEEPSTHIGWDAFPSDSSSAPPVETR